ncbi:hypothetical protein OHB14_50910 [Streptomyces sp. NBC_01613]
MWHLIGGYHPSQRNMSACTLTPAMLRDLLHSGADIADERSAGLLGDRP